MDQEQAPKIVDNSAAALTGQVTTDILDTNVVLDSNAVASGKDSDSDYPQLPLSNLEKSSADSVETGHFVSPSQSPTKGTRPCLSFQTLMCTD